MLGSRPLVERPLPVMCEVEERAWVEVNQATFLNVWKSYCCTKISKEISRLQLIPPTDADEKESRRFGRGKELPTSGNSSESSNLIAGRRNGQGRGYTKIPGLLEFGLLCPVYLLMRPEQHFPIPPQYCACFDATFKPADSSPSLNASRRSVSTALSPSPPPPLI